MPRPGLIALLLLAAASPARAEFAYARWGMSEAAVVAAARGAVAALPAGERRAAGPLEYRVAGSHSLPGARLQVAFGFDAGALACVSLRGEASAAPALRAWYSRQFGPPEIGGDAAQSVLAWSRPDRIEVIVQGDVLLGLHCRR